MTWKEAELLLLTAAGDDFIVSLMREFYSGRKVHRSEGWIHLQAIDGPGFAKFFRFEDPDNLDGAVHAAVDVMANWRLARAEAAQVIPKLDDQHPLIGYADALRGGLLSRLAASQRLVRWTDEITVTVG